MNEREELLARLKWGDGTFKAGDNWKKLTDAAAALIRSDAQRIGELEGQIKAADAAIASCRRELDADLKMFRQNQEAFAAAESRLREVEAWLNATQENRNSWLRKHDLLLPLVEICEKLQEEANWTLDGDGTGNALARFLRALALAPDRTAQGQESSSALKTGSTVSATVPDPASVAAPPLTYKRCGECGRWGGHWSWCNVIPTTA